MITMKDIAAKSGVSQATVSRVINGNTAVDPLKRQVVMEWVRRLQYRPNYSAMVLARKRSFLIGMILPDLQNPYFSEIIQQVELQAQHHGYNVIICNSEGKQYKEQDHLMALRSRQVDCLLIVPTDTKALAPLKDISIPVLVLTQDSTMFDSVAVSHFHGGVLAARHLLQLGRVKPLMIGTPIEGTHADEKFLGFQETYAAEGITLTHHIPITPWAQNVSRVMYESTRNYFMEHGIQHFDSIFTANDTVAFGVAHVLQELRIAIPDKIAMIGFDNTYLAKGMYPTLTSIGQPTEEIGRMAMERILSRVDNTKEMQPKHISLHPYLVVRESTIGSRQE